MARPICIVGTGYVGMASLIGLAELGWTVHGYDIIPDRIRKLRAGIAPYREAGIDESLRKHIDAGRIHFFDTLEDAARHSELIIVAVGTPAREDGSADISAVYSAVDALSKIDFTAWPTVCIRSTVPPGTSNDVAELVDGWGELIYGPEFLREGSAVYDFLHPDRIVAGCESTAAAVPYVRLFESLQTPIVFTSRCNAEMIKCCSNAFLALKISFANEIANLCDAIGATSDDVLRGIGYDKRIGPDFLRPGIGFGGPCFEKDVKSIAHVAGTHQVGHELFSATLRVNQAQPLRVLSLLEAEVGSVAGLTVGVWGLAFKAGTEDMRDSIAVRVVEMLSARGAYTVAYDPAVRVAALPAGSRLVQTALEAAECDVLLVLTDWPEFATIHPELYAGSIRRASVIDGRNILDGGRVASAGLKYRGIGRFIDTTNRPAAMALAQ